MGAFNSVSAKSPKEDGARIPSARIPNALSSVKNEMVSSTVELARRMAERQMAMQVASVRELLVWFVPFVVSSYGFLYYGYRKTNSWVVMFPLIPITFGLGYQIHYAYGNKTNQIKALAERIMSNETHMMAVPEWSTSVPPPTERERTTQQEHGSNAP